MAQSLSAAGLAPERAYAVAQVIQRALEERGAERIPVTELRALTENVVRREEGEQAAARLRAWQRLKALDRPLIVVLSGTTGVGKSTLATMLAHRLGITRVIATDVVRQVLRAYFPYELMPLMHHSAFEAGRAVDPSGAYGPGDPDLVGFTAQADQVLRGIAGVVERACVEGTPMVLEGIHLMPGGLDDVLCGNCLAVQACLVVPDRETHRGHFALRGPERPAERYLGRFEQIRKLQDLLVARAEGAGVAVIENATVDEALGRLMDLVLGAVGRVPTAKGG
jgi:2-phosphoglycerate kinase